MKNAAIWFVAISSTLAGICAAPAQQLTPEIVSLDNGMKFILVPRHDEPNTISAGWLAKVGSVNERPGITGISHFFEHMMFKGTNTIGTPDKERDAQYRAEQKKLRDAMNLYTWTTQYQRFFLGEIDDPWNVKNDTPVLAKLRADLKKSMDSQQGRGNTTTISDLKKELAGADRATADGAAKAKGLEGQIADLEAEQKQFSSINKDEFDKIYTKAGGARMNAFTSFDLTFYFIQVPSNKFELWCWMESDRLNDSVFREFYSERDVVHEERRLRTESTPTGAFQEQFDAMFWISCPYAWPVIGWTSDLNSYSMEEAMKYWNIYYRPNNIVGIIVGDFDPAEVKPMIESYFSRLQTGILPPPPVITLEAKQMAEQRMNAEADCQPQVEVRYHTVPALHADSYALDMLTGILNGRTGRLYKSMVEGKEIASSASSQQDSRHYAGAFSFSAETKGDASPEQLEEAWYAELKIVQDKLVPEEELQKIKNNVAADHYRGLQANFRLMIGLAISEAMGGWEEINENPKKLQAVTPADIQRVARQYFAESNRSVATFLRKASAAAEAPADPDIAALPAPMQARAKQMLAQVMKDEDLAGLKAGLAQMEGQTEQVPPPMKPMFELMARKIKERIAQLESAGGGK
ncbi:MAG: insulinase family protein [Phycisphaerales bacterium]|nr:insulinase family protein [Phycisphaerales bacterium]